jgi:hypothetical protein
MTKSRFFSKEFDMSDQPRETSKSKSDATKKKNETVHLSADELRKISGGAASPPSSPAPNDLSKKIKP